jgi:type II secretory pathway component PulF
VKTFTFNAVDQQGRPVSGSVEAADWQAAAALLIARGLRECRQPPQDPPAEKLPALSAADALELASYLSQLAKGGLPLASALRAGANDLPSGPLPRAMSALAARLEAGHSLDSALESLSSRLPARLREMLIAGAGSGRLAETLEAILAHDRGMEDMTRQFWQAAVYPTVVLGFLVAWLLFTSLWLVPAMHVDSLLSDLSTAVARVAPASKRLSEFARVTPPLLLATLCVTAMIVGVAWVIGGAGAVSRMFAHVPLLGPAWWYRGLAEFCGLLSVFLEQRLPLDDALRRISTTARDPAVAAACRKAADEVAQGKDLSQCLERNALFPATLIYFARWGQRHSALSEALASARQMYCDRLELQTQLVRLIFPPIVFLLVAGSVLFVVGGIYGALQQIIVDLSTWTRSAPRRVPFADSIQLSGLASVFVVGVSLLAAAHVLKTMAGEADASRRLLRYTGFVLIAVGLLGSCLMAGGFWGLVALLIAMGVWWRGATHYRAAQKRNLFSALALAVEKQMPLAPMALAFAHEQEGGFADRAYALAQKLEAGASLSDAIVRSSRTLPPEAALAAHVAAESGDLPGAFSATTYNSVFDRTLLRPVMLRLIYVFPAMLIFLAYMKIKIEPSMAAIFRDFDTDLPLLTRGVMGLTGTAGTMITTFFLLMVAMIVLTVLAWLQWRGTLQPRLPGLKRTINWVDMGAVLRVLALAARSNRPLPNVLHAISRFHPKRSIRNRMRWVVRDTNNGRPWQESLQRQRLLGATDAALLAAAQRSGNLSWALGEMAESFERRATHRLQALAQIVLPVMLLPVGICVLLLAVAYFSPLTLLIENLS